MAVKRCPLCHKANATNAWQCECGYRFGQSVEKSLQIVRSQLHNAHLIFWLLLAIDLGVIGLVVWSALAGRAVVIVPSFGFAYCVVKTVRAGQKIALTRASIRSLEKQKLPEARVASQP